VFAILRPGSIAVDVAAPELDERFQELLATVQRVQREIHKQMQRSPAILGAVAIFAQMAKRSLDRKLKELLDPIAEAGAAAFALLPERIQRLLAGGDTHVVFLAPCGATVNVPFELLRPPGGHYLGLDRLLPRVHSLAELARVLDRRPPANGPRTALVIGDPCHQGAKRLPHASQAASTLAGRLEQTGFRLVPAGDPLIDPEGIRPEEGRVTAEVVLQALERAGELALLAAMCHGDRPSGETWEGIEYLAMSGTSRFYPFEVARRKLPGTIVHHDACVAGTVRARGGGRFDGHPTAALLAGASCVLSSVHPLWDQPAAEFSDHLYERVLSQGEAMGPALLATRQEMDRRYHGNPLVWATTVFWGNPWVRLTEGA
jgi:hypothetical protein